MRLITLAVFLMLITGTGVAAGTAPAATNWYKGNTHSHTNVSDGDSSPVVVAEWYRDHGYDFLAITDHNKRTDPDRVETELAARPGAGKPKPFLLIAGEELSDVYRNGKRAFGLHYNALGVTKLIEPKGGATFLEVSNRSYAAIEEAGGLAILNHPNFVWSVTQEDMVSLAAMTHFEVWNGVPCVHNLGGEGSASTDEMWDRVLSTGRQLYGLACDDAHHFRDIGYKRANPGRGWIHVRAASLATTDILSAIRGGDFYATTGVEFEDIATTGNVLRLKIKPGWADFPGWAEKYRTTFIGRNGAVLKRDSSLEPFYKLRPGDLYVRARVISSNGWQGWTQPLFRKRQK